MNKSLLKRAEFWFSIIFGLLSALTNYAQTTEFTYQGKLSVTGTQAATYDFEFRLCASQTTCATPLAVDAQTGIALSSGGVFNVKINFGAAHFGADDDVWAFSI